MKLRIRAISANTTTINAGRKATAPAKLVAKKETMKKFTRSIGSESMPRQSGAIMPIASVIPAIMSWSLNIGKVAGTVVRVHLTFLLFLAWIFAGSYASGGAATAWDSLAFMVLLFLCVLLHEFGHIFTARAFGVPTPYVTLLPIGGVAQLERIPEEPWEEFLIAIAGPMVNIVIAVALVYLFDAHLHSSAAMGVENLKIPLVDRLAAVNLFLALFNMIPAFPMIVGEHTRGNDLVVNVLKGKKLTNIRTTSKDEAVRLTPPIRMTLEKALAYIEDDELVEVTPKSIRLRKKLLDENDRKKAERAKEAETV